MAHEHVHRPSANYYLDQLCAVGCAGIIGAICVLLYTQQWLNNLLKWPFDFAVFIGGLVLLALTFARGVSLWRESGRVHDHHHEEDIDACESNHDHDHAHGESCGHDHAHDAEYTWMPVKYAVLVVAMGLLYMVGYLNMTFSDEHIQRSLEMGALESTGGESTAPTGDPTNAIPLGFRELSEAAYTPSARKHFEGKYGKLAGRVMKLPGSDKDFTLFRIKMRCCAADAVPVQVRIISPKSLTQLDNQTWVEVTGQIQFRKLAGKDQYLPVLHLPSVNAVKKTAPPKEGEFLDA